MTVINGIESFEFNVRKLETKQAILNNEMIEENLHVIMVISNPCEFKRRWFLAKQFKRQMEVSDNVILYIV